MRPFYLSPTLTFLQRSPHSVSSPSHDSFSYKDPRCAHPSHCAFFLLLLQHPSFVLFVSLLTCCVHRAHQGCVSCFFFSLCLFEILHCPRLYSLSFARSLISDFILRLDLLPFPFHYCSSFVRPLPLVLSDFPLHPNFRWLLNCPPLSRWNFVCCLLASLLCLFSACLAITLSFCFEWFAFSHLSSANSFDFSRR